MNAHKNHILLFDATNSIINNLFAELKILNNRKIKNRKIIFDFVLFNKIINICLILILIIFGYSYKVKRIYKNKN